MLINRVSRLIRNPFCLVAFFLWIMFFIFGQRFLGNHPPDEDLSSQHPLDLRKHWLLRSQLRATDKITDTEPEKEEEAKGEKDVSGRRVSMPRVDGQKRSSGSQCRNSRQGADLLVDDQGFVCKRSDLQHNGCCPPDSRARHRFVCNTCNRNHCCHVYEFCVSCCMHPNKRDLLHRALRAAVDAVPSGGGHKVLLVSLSDQFELCLAKCRTSSTSVHHENQYRDAAARFCYGPTPPQLVTTVD